MKIGAEKGAVCDMQEVQVAKVRNRSVILASHEAINPSPADSDAQLALNLNRMTGSQAKTAYALRKNVETMVVGNSLRDLKWVEITARDGKRKRIRSWTARKAENLSCVGFMTLTVGDSVFEPELQADGSTRMRKRFKQVHEHSEANRRINNLNRRVLPAVFEKWVIVTERHKSGAIHYHLVGILRGRPNIRRGFNWKEVRQRNYKSVCQELRGIWANLLRTLPRYGFGRCELTPIEKTSEEIASYVSKYIEKNLKVRKKEDKRKKLVRYGGWNRPATFRECRQAIRAGKKPPKGISTHLKPNCFSWGTAKAHKWRTRARRLASFVGITEREDMTAKFGPRWAFAITNVMNEIDTKWPMDFWEMERGEVNKATRMLEDEVQKQISACLLPLARKACNENEIFCAQLRRRRDQRDTFAEVVEMWRN